MNKLARKLSQRAARLVPARLAEDLIDALERRVGIGSGGSASRSGEGVVFDLLDRSRATPLTLFDVGANQGQYASQALSRLGSSCDYTIHCFEPSPASFESLSAKHGDEARAKLNAFGLADCRKKAILYMDAKRSGLASVTQRRLDHFGIDHGKIREEIELDTLDAYCADHGIEHIDLLKVDVEGHELDVLMGGRDALEGNRIDLVQFEFGGCNIDTRTYYQDFFYFFAEREFELFRILPGEKLLQLPKYREVDEKFRTANYLAASRPMELARRFERIVV